MAELKEPPRPEGPLPREPVVILGEDIETGTPFPLRPDVAIPKKMLDTLASHKKERDETKNAIRALLSRIICDDFDNRYSDEARAADYAIVPAMRFCLDNHYFAARYLRELLPLADKLDQANADTRCARLRIQEYAEQQKPMETYPDVPLNSPPDYLHPLNDDDV